MTSEEARRTLATLPIPIRANRSTDTFTVDACFCPDCYRTPAMARGRQRDSDRLAEQGDDFGYERDGRDAVAREIG